MAWLALSIGGYFLNAATIVIDKFLLRRALPHPVAYAIGVSAAGSVALFAAPLLTAAPSAYVMFLALASGMLFTYGLLALFTLLARREASQVAPLVGGLQPVFIFILAGMFIGEKLTGAHLFAFFLTVLGTVFISGEGNTIKHVRGKTFIEGALAALLFALSYTFSKITYLEYGFLGGLVLRTAGTLIGAGTLLIPRRNREIVGNAFQGAGSGVSALFLVGQLLGAGSFVLIHYAISIGPTALVSALAGSQYAFIFVLALLMTRFAPQIVKERMSSGVIVQKTLSLILIGAGIALLFLS